MERVNEREPAVGLTGGDFRQLLPVGLTVGFFYLRLREINPVELCTWQRIKREYDTGVFLQLLIARHERSAGTTRKQRNARMDAEDFENLFRLRKKARRHEHKTKRHLRRAQLVSQIFRPFAQPGFVEVLLPMC